jgi:DNA-directed RNA polymerase subunit RPC12/RpoP
MEKYGYEQDDEKTKVAESQNSELVIRCPRCGAKANQESRPPTCPRHGSEPFEKHDDEG